MIETAPTVELLLAACLLVVFVWSAVVLLKWIFLNAKAWLWLLFERLARLHWKLHRRFFPSPYFYGMDLAIGDDYTAIVTCRRERDGRVTVLDCKVFSRKSL